MKLLLLLFTLGLLSTTMYSQIEIPRSTNSGDLLRVEPDNNSSGNFPSFRLREEKREESRFLKEDKPEGLDFRETKHDLLTESDVVAKKWKEDKEAKAEYKNDQYMGDFKTSGKLVELYCRDHQSVDGDKVRIYVNGEVIQNSVSLGGGYKPILVTLVNGFNNIEFEALNQGSSGPNTAQLKVLDENGKLVASKEWNLLTGAKASIIVVKE